MFPRTLPIPVRSPSGENTGKHVCLLLVGCLAEMGEWVDSDWPNMILAPSHVTSGDGSAFQVVWSMRRKGRSQ